MEHLTESLIEIPNGSYLDEEILEQFKSGLKKQPWTLIKAYKLKRLYQGWSRGIVDKELLEDCLSIAIENLQKIIVNGNIVYYAHEITDDNLDRWNEFIEDEYGDGRYTEEIERFKLLLVKLIYAETDQQKMIALDTALGTFHGVGGIAKWFVKSGGKTLDEIFEWRDTLEKSAPTEHLTESLTENNPDNKLRHIFPTGRAWRAESSLWIKGKTAQDIVDFEADELGNEDIREQAESIGLDLRAIPEREVVWVTATRKEAEIYSMGGKVPIVEIEIPRNSVILATDYQGGYLVWLRNSTEHLT